MQIAIRPVFSAGAPQARVMLTRAPAIENMLCQGRITAI
jgi:hypothetical protein